MNSSQRSIPTPPHRPRLATLVALLASALAPLAGRADTPAPNAEMRFVDLGAQADNQGNRQVQTTLSLPVGRHAWAQAGVGQSRSDAAAGGRKPGIVTGAVGVGGESMQLSVNANHRADGSKYRQTDVGASLDWRRDGSGVGVEVSHRRSQAAGTLAVSDGIGGSTTIPAQARVSGNGVGVHGTLQVSEHLSVYGAAVRNHYRSSTTGADASSPGGLLGSNPLLARALFGGTSVVNQDEVALDHSVQAGATYRWDKVALSGEVLSGQVIDHAGAMRSVDVKAAIAVAAGWRVTPGIGRGTSDEGGHATFASLSATYGW